MFQKESRVLVAENSCSLGSACWLAWEFLRQRLCMRRDNDVRGELYFFMGKSRGGVSKRKVKPPETMRGILKLAPPNFALCSHQSSNMKEFELFRNYG